VKNFLAAKDVSIDVLFEQGVDTVVPDVGSVKYTLYDNNGAAISGAVDVPVTTTTATTSIAVLTTAGQNTKALAFETRTLVVTYKVSGGTRTQTYQYRLTNNVPFSINEDSVRSFIGVSRTELPNQDIDIYMAYIGVCADIGSTAVNAALVAADATQIAVNKAIVCQALIDILPGIQLRLLQDSHSNTAQVTRFYKMDFEALMDRILGIYDDAIAVIVPDPSPGTIGAGVLMGVTTMVPDPVTGV
jgi:hypothetical protein